MFFRIARDSLATMVQVASWLAISGSYIVGQMYLAPCPRRQAMYSSMGILDGSVFGGAAPMSVVAAGGGALVVRATGAGAADGAPYALAAAVASMAPKAMYICAAGRLAMRWASAGFFASSYTMSGP